LIKLLPRESRCFGPFLAILVFPTIVEQEFNLCQSRHTTCYASHVRRTRAPSTSFFYTSFRTNDISQWQVHLYSKLPSLAYELRPYFFSSQDPESSTHSPQSANHPSGLLNQLTSPNRAVQSANLGLTKPCPPISPSPNQYSSRIPVSPRPRYQQPYSSHNSPSRGNTSNPSTRPYRSSDLLIVIYSFLLASSSILSHSKDSQVSSFSAEATRYYYQPTHLVQNSQPNASSTSFCPRLASSQHSSFPSTGSHHYSPRISWSPIQPVHFQPSLIDTTYKHIHFGQRIQHLQLILLLLILNHLQSFTCPPFWLLPGLYPLFLSKCIHPPSSFFLSPSTYSNLSTALSMNPYDVLRDTEPNVEEDRPQGDTLESNAWGDGISSTSSNSSKTSVTGWRNKPKKAKKSAKTKLMDLEVAIAQANLYTAKSSEENSAGSSRTAQSKFQAPKPRPFTGPFGRNPGWGGGLSQSRYLPTSAQVRNTTSSLSAAMRAARASLDSTKTHLQQQSETLSGNPQTQPIMIASPCTHPASESPSKSTSASKPEHSTLANPVGTFFTVQVQLTYFLTPSTGGVNVASLFTKWAKASFDFLPNLSLSSQSNHLQLHRPCSACFSAEWLYLR